MDTPTICSGCNEVYDLRYAAVRAADGTPYCSWRCARMEGHTAADLTTGER
jgi:hypothetical protein